YECVLLKVSDPTVCALSTLTVRSPVMMFPNRAPSAGLCGTPAVQLPEVFQLWVFKSVFQVETVIPPEPTISSVTKPPLVPKVYENPLTGFSTCSEVGSPFSAPAYWNRLNVWSPLGE